MALRGVARALRCAKLRVVREHLVLPLGGAHLLQLVEGRAAVCLLRGQDRARMRLENALARKIGCVF